MTFEGSRNATSLPAGAFGQSQLDLLDGLTIASSGPGRALASPSALPATGSGSMIQGICGPTFIASSVPDGPLSSWESKLRERLGSIGSTESALIWRRTVSPAGLSLSRLAPLTRRRSESASIGPRSTWPAPQVALSHAEDPEKHAARQKRMTAKGSRFPGQNLPTLMTAAWAAVTARDGKNANAKPFKERGGGKKGEQLVNQIAHFAPGTALGGLTPSGLPVTTGKRGVPNPVFAFWLMGFPDEWVSGALAAMRSRQSSRRK
jgi:hypothetical protein